MKTYFKICLIVLIAVIIYGQIYTAITGRVDEFVAPWVGEINHYFLFWFFLRTVYRQFRKMIGKPVAVKVNLSKLTDEEIIDRWVNAA